MPLFHKQTEHSYQSVRKNSFFLDWRTQPTNFKNYPHFYQRINISEFDALKGLDLIGGITYKKSYPEGMYYLRTNPSAGALYPCEIYIQIRGIKGLLSGIYHYEPKSATLCLLYECNLDSIEFYFQDKKEQKGFIFLISSSYFRSSWKYANRSIRYILLDSGHALGAIYAAMCVMQRESALEFDFDKLSLNQIFGFRHDEMFSVALKSAISSTSEVKEIKQSFAYVSPSDYLEKNEFIENAYKQSCDYTSKPIENLQFFKGISKKELENAIMNRRSIRAFRMESISQRAFEFIINGLFEFANLYNIEIFYTLHNVEDMAMGLYLGKELLCKGDFRDKSKYLALEQNLGGQSAVTFYLTSNEVEAYQKVSILSGFIAHIIYLRCTLQCIGCSGIGAYYDVEVQEFLKTKNNILYMLAIGK